jgi:NADH dehydrogenase
MVQAERPRVVIIGSGFGGLFTARRLVDSPVEVTLLARTSHHLFQPLLYQVATGVLSQGEIAPATREILRRQLNARVVLAEVVDIDLAAHQVVSTSPVGEFATPYDYLVVAAGAGQSYFGNDGFAEHAPGMKSIDDALELRGRIFGAFERAEVATDPELVRRLLTFVVVGAGPTGVEMAGQIAELSRRALRSDFRRIDPTSARIVLVDAADAVLGSFGPKLARAGARRLTEMGVEVKLGLKVVDLDAAGVELEDRTGTRQRIESYCKVWAAGVSASPLGKRLAEQSGADIDGAGRVRVNPDLTLPGHPEVFVIGDMAALDNLPGVAQVAMQGAKHTAEQIGRAVTGHPESRPFHYHDKGSMATVSRFYAVASIGKLRLSGLVAWLMWLVIHLIYLVGFKNRLTTLLRWTVSFVGRGRSERTVTAQQILGRTALRRLRNGQLNQWELSPAAGATAAEGRVAPPEG